MPPGATPGIEQRKERGKIKQRPQKCGGMIRNKEIRREERDEAEGTTDC